MSDIPVFVVSLANVARMHTVGVLSAAKIPFTVVVHDRAAKQRMRAAGMRCEVAVTTGGTRTLWEKRNWILDNLVSRGSWYVSMDDNIRGFTMVADEYLGNEENDTQGPHPWGRSWREIYNRDVSPRAWMAELARDVAMADKRAIPLVGVATMENPYFRAKRYSFYRFVKGKVFAMLNTGDLRYKYNVCEDSYMSAQVVARYGRVLVDSFLHHKSKMYEPGGIGDRAARERLGLTANLQAICAEFPGLVSVGRGENTALKFRLVTETGVTRWREENGYV